LRERAIVLIRVGGVYRDAGRLGEGLDGLVGPSAVLGDGRREYEIWRPEALLRDSSMIARNGIQTTSRRCCSKGEDAYRELSANCDRANPSYPSTSGGAAVDSDAVPKDLDRIIDAALDRRAEVLWDDAGHRAPMQIAAD
jgi:hypothetical protein